MKNRTSLLFASITSALCILAISIAAGCGTPAQNLATANYLAGNAYATYELGKSAASLPGLQHLATVLPQIPTGKVTPFELGQLNAQLHAEQAGAPANSDLKNQIGSLISAVSQAEAASNGGNPTVNTAILQAALTDAANGIQHGIDFWRGQQSVNAPPGA